MQPYIIGFDTETALMRPGLKIPPQTCLSWWDPQRNQGGVVDRHRGHEMFRDWLRNPSIRLVAHNLAYDTAVLGQEFPDLQPAIFNKYDQNGFEDTLLNEQLIDIAEGHFRYEVTEDEETGEEVIQGKKYALGDLFPGMDKDTYRYGYGPLRDVPVDRWERGFVDYALQDAQAACHLWWRQRERVGGQVPDAFAQARASFSLHLMSAWGMRTDEEMARHLQVELDAVVSQLRVELIMIGFMDPKKGSVNTEVVKQATVRALANQGLPPVLTEKGNVSISADVLKVAARKDPRLFALMRYKDNQKILTTYVPALLDGTQVPINASFNTLVETGRTSCSRPNLQNLPRGKLKKDPTDLSYLVRECFVPRNGFVFNSTDYDSLELRTLAQVLKDLVGGQTLMREYQRDPKFDPHSRLAARMLGLSYEEGIRRKKAKDAEFADRRQMSKAGNFGYPGGMGPRKMTTYAFKSYDVEISMSESKALRQFFVAACPEIQPYWRLNDHIVRFGGARVAQLRSGRVRGGLRYTDANNGWFQALAADGAKAALWEVTKKCYLDGSSALYGCRPVAFVHDEIITEMPRAQAHEASLVKTAIMCDTMRLFTPDIPIEASPALMERWYKGADEVYDARGRLIPWKPKSGKV